MALAIRPATDSTFSFSHFFASGSAIVFVTVTSSIGDARSRSTAGPDSRAWVANAKMRPAPSRRSAAAASVIVPAVSIMSSGMRQSLPSTSPTTFTTSAMFADGRRLSMVHRNVEESLDLVRMEIDAQHSVRARMRDHIRHQLRADRHARLIFAILARVPEIREHRRHARGARPPRRIDQEQQLEVVLRRRVGGLDDEDIAPPHILVDLDEDFAVREPPDRYRTQRLPQMLSHLLGERPVGRPGEQQELAARQRQVAHWSPGK